MSEAVIKVEDEHIHGKLTNFITGRNIKDLGNAKTNLSRAITMTAKNANGEALKLEVEHEKGGVQFDVFVRSGDKTNKVKIDGTTGKTL